MVLRATDLMIDSVIEAGGKTKKKPCGRCTRCTKKTAIPSSCSRTTTVPTGCPCPTGFTEELMTLQHLLRIKLEALRNAA